MSITITLRTLPEDILPIICDHYGDQRQLRALSNIAHLNHHISNYARTRLYHRIEFVDDRSSRALENANDLCRIYEDGDALDTDILDAIDCREIDPLDLDSPLRWLRGMRTCQVMVIQDMLYGRDIESLCTLATSLSSRGLVPFPKVNQVTISAKIVKRILATEANGPRPKQTPMDLFITLFQATRPKRLCIQDSAIFTPPTHRHVRRIARQEQVGGRQVPSRGGHMSHTTIQWIEGMAELEEIRYHEVKPDVPIYPKKGIRHVVSFIQGPVPPSDSFFSRVHHTYTIISAIKDIIQRSVMGSPQFTAPPPRPLPSGAFSYESASSRDTSGTGGNVAGNPFGSSNTTNQSTSTSANPGLGGPGGFGPTTTNTSSFTFGNPASISTSTNPGVLGGFGAAGSFTSTTGGSGSNFGFGFGNPASTSTLPHPAGSGGIGAAGSSTSTTGGSLSTVNPPIFGFGFGNPASTSTSTNPGGLGGFGAAGSSTSTTGPIILDASAFSSGIGLANPAYTTTTNPGPVRFRGLSDFLNAIDFNDPNRYDFLDLFPTTTVGGFGPAPQPSSFASSSAASAAAGTSATSTGAPSFRFGQTSTLSARAGPTPPIRFADSRSTTTTADPGRSGFYPSSISTSTPGRDTRPFSFGQSSTARNDTTSGDRRGFSFGQSSTTGTDTTSGNQLSFSFAASSASSSSVPAPGGGSSQPTQGFSFGDFTTAAPAVPVTNANTTGSFGNPFTTNNGSTTSTVPPPAHLGGDALPAYNNLSAQITSIFAQNQAIFGGTATASNIIGSNTVTGQATRRVERDKPSPPMYNQSSWHFIIPGGKSEMDRVKQDIMDWAEGFGCALGDGVRAGITFAVKEEEGKCGCCGC